jgi:hypothetical protein
VDGHFLGFRVPRSGMTTLREGLSGIAAARRAVPTLSLSLTLNPLPNLNLHLNLSLLFDSLV